MGSWALIRQLEDTEAERQDRPHGKFDSNELLPAASSNTPPRISILSTVLALFPQVTPTSQ